MRWTLKARPPRWIVNLVSLIVAISAPESVTWYVKSARSPVRGFLLALSIKRHDWEAVAMSQGDRLVEEDARFLVHSHARPSILNRAAYSLQRLVKCMKI